LRMPGARAQEWRRGRDAVDLHWRLPGAEPSGAPAWRALQRHRRAIAVGDVTATTLDDPGTALLLALHAAHHGSATPKPLRDLELGLAAIADWAGAAGLAEGVGATDPFAAGLRTV